MTAVLAELRGLLQCQPPRRLCPHPLLLTAALAAPHFLYAFIWFMPRAWQQLFPRNPVDAFATCGLIGKVVQAAAVALYVAALRPAGLCLLQPPGSIPLAQWLACLVLVACGQSLNVGIFRAIGHAGVYYGSKLGARGVPWVTGWPFDAVAHPQYVGSVMTVWGLVALLWSSAPSAHLLVLGGFWTALYAVTAMHEQHM